MPIFRNVDPLNASPPFSRQTEWLAAFDSVARLTDDEKVRRLQAIQDRRDVSGAARQRLVIAALGRAEIAPSQAIGHLRQAIVVFDASGLLRESRLARSELAAQLIEAASPAEALVVLVQAASIPVAANGAAWAAERARFALALFDQGSVAAAVDVIREILNAPEAWNGADPSRLAQQAWAAVLDVLLGSALVMRDIDSGLTDGAVGCTQLSRIDGKVGLHELLSFAAKTAHHHARSSIHVASQLAVLHAMDNPAGAAERCESLTSVLSEQHSHHALAWLRLALAYRLAGRRVLAAHCANEAVMAARAQHHTRSHRRALVEMALIQHESGAFAEAAATWLSLRHLLRESFGDQQSDGRAFIGYSAEAASVAEASSLPDRPSQVHVRLALEAIASESPRDLTVPALALQCGVSRRTLEQAFRGEKGQTVGETIRQRKLQIALHLLERTDHAIKRVAIDAGFGSASSLCRELRRHTGLSPVQYRLRARTD